MLSFVRRHAALLIFGIVLTYFSSFGQTFLISLYIPEIERVFGLSNTGLSSLYAAATMGSAFTLPWIGRLVDTWPLRRFTLLVVIGFMLACGLLSIAFHPAVVLLGFYGLRLSGQGLMSHTSISTMSRAFTGDRGKAISMATLGHPLGEATLPLLITFLIGSVGWRSTLQGSGVSLLLLVLPLVLLLLRRQPRDLLFPGVSLAQKKQLNRNPLRVLLRRKFWIIAPAVFIVGYLNTAVFFFQLKLGEARGWDPSWVAGSLSAYAIASALSMTAAGPVVDKVSARRLFPFILFPYLVGVALLGTIQAYYWYPVALVLLAISHGAGSTIKNALFAEIFGVEIIGTVRSVFTTVMVFSTALGPVSFGLLLDADWTYSRIFWLMAILVLGIIVWSFQIWKSKRTT